MSHTLDQHEIPQPALGPPRFSLRALLLAVSALCCLFALMAAVGLVWSAAIALLLTLVLAHVLGNSLGTKLRDQTSRQVAADRQGCGRQSAMVATTDLLGPRRLAERARLNRVTLLMAIGGALIGGELGGLGAASIYPQASLAAVGLGVLSAAVLGAFAGFLASSFLSVVRQALAEAHRGANPAQRRNVPGQPR
jgi:hypothetical protein